MISIESNKINKDSVEYKTMICSINESITEHSVVGPYLNQISDITNNYTPPQDACNTVIKSIRKSPKTPKSLNGSYTT